MITLQQILVATDFSEPSSAALVYGRELARAFGATLQVLHVVDDLGARLLEPSAYPELDRLQAEAEATALTRLNGLLSEDDRQALHATDGASCPGQSRRKGREHGSVSGPHRSASSTRIRVARLGRASCAGLTASCCEEETMNLIRLDPFRELEDMSSRLNRFFGRPNGEEADGFGTWSPAIDVQETDKEYLVKADMPEVNKTDLKVNVEDGILTVEGERKQEKEEQGKKFHRVERLYGRFVRRLTVPSDVDGTKVAAEFKDGVLSVHMPKSPLAQPRSIDVKVM